MRERKGKRSEHDGKYVVKPFCTYFKTIHKFVFTHSLNETYISIHTMQRLRVDCRQKDRTARKGTHGIALTNHSYLDTFPLQVHEKNAVGGYLCYHTSIGLLRFRSGDRRRGGKIRGGPIIKEKAVCLLSLFHFLSLPLLTFHLFARRVRWRAGTIDIRPSSLVYLVVRGPFLGLYIHLVLCEKGALGTVQRETSLFFLSKGTQNRRER